MPHIPRFRALALFGRRPLERVDSPTIPASENLHTSGSRRLAIARSVVASITDVPQAKKFISGRKQPTRTSSDVELAQQIPFAMRHALGYGSLVEAPAPGAGTITDDAGKDAREMTLISKAAGQRHFRERQRPVAHQALRFIDPASQQPLMGR